MTNARALLSIVIAATTLASSACDTRGGSGLIGIGRPPTTASGLASLTLSAGNLSPAFTSATTSYTAAVTNNITSITVTPTAVDPAAQIIVNGAAVTSGTPSPVIGLQVGTNTVSVNVTPPGGTSPQVYTVIVTRAGP